MTAGAPPACAAVPPGLALGVTAADYRYREPGLAMAEQGVRWGAAVDYVLAAPGAGPFLRAGLEGSRGRLRYQGSGTLDGVPDLHLESRLSFGWSLPAGQRAVLAPYLGYGWRRTWNDLRGVTTTGARGYRRESAFTYLPLGCAARVPLGEAWTLAPAAEYAWVAGGRSTSRFGDADPALATARNRLGGGHGFRLELLLATGRIAFGPWLRGWDLAASDTVAIGGSYQASEPANRTREAGLLVRWWPGAR